jgi:hypothetical protein
MNPQALGRTGKILREALGEQRTALRTVYQKAGELLQAPPDTPPEYEVRLGSVPDSFYALRKNLFSTLFQSVYHLMGCAPSHRVFYGQLVHLFRIWVTGADNLLDQENKTVLPLALPGSAPVMRQVISIMAADRILQQLLFDGIDAGLLTSAQARELSARSLQILLPSAAQEASEELGITDRPDPSEVLSVIHRYKTGLLFNVAFLAPEILEPDLPPARTAALKEALMRFGTGCQVLDDIRDLARDYLERRHNYLLSDLQKNRPDFFQTLEHRSLAVTDRLYLEVLPVAVPAAQLGFSLMRDGLAQLGKMGLGIGEKTAERLAGTLFVALDLEDLRYA